MSVHLKAGESYNLTTGRKESAHRAPTDPMDRPVGTLAQNDARAMYAAVRRTCK